MTGYPTLVWVRQQLTCNFVARVRKKVLAAYIVGSEARSDKTARPDSDLDIAVIIEPMARKTSLQFTEQYHIKFGKLGPDKGNRMMPHWEGRRVDFEFFYPGEIEALGYQTIKIETR